MKYLKRVSDIPRDTWLDAQWLAKLQSDAKAFHEWASDNRFDIIVKSWDANTDEFKYKQISNIKLDYGVDEDCDEDYRFSSTDKNVMSWGSLPKDVRVVSFRTHGDCLANYTLARDVYDDLTTAHIDDEDEDPIDGVPKDRPKRKRSAPHPWRE